MENLPVILAAAVGLLLIGFSQSAGDARAFAAKHKYRVDIDQESVAQGICQRGLRPGAGHSRLHQPVGQLTE